MFSCTCTTFMKMLHTTCIIQILQDIKKIDLHYMENYILEMETVLDKPKRTYKY